MNLHKLQVILILAFVLGIIGSLAVGLSVARSQKQLEINGSSMSIDASVGERWSICVRLPEGTPDAQAPNLAEHIQVQVTSGLSVNQAESRSGRVLWDRHGSQVRMFYEIDALSDGRITVSVDQRALSYDLVAVPFSWVRLAWEGGLFCLFCSVGLLGILGYMVLKIYGAGLRDGQQ